MEPRVLHNLHKWSTPELPPTPWWFFFLYQIRFPRTTNSFICYYFTFFFLDSSGSLISKLPAGCLSLLKTHSDISSIQTWTSSFLTNPPGGLQRWLSSQNMLIRFWASPSCFQPPVTSDPGWFSAPTWTLTTICNYSPGNLMPSSGLPRLQTHMWYPYTHAGKHSYTSNKNK